MTNGSPRTAFFSVLSLSFAFALGACRASETAPAPAAAAATHAAPARALTDVERVIALAERDAQVEEHLRHLCKEIGPRLTSSHRLQQALEWTRDEFASWGLDAHLESWGDFPVGFDRGPQHGALVAPETADLVFTTRAWTPGTSGPKRARAYLYPRNDEEFAALDGRLAGAWIVSPSYTKEERPSTELRKKVDAALTDAGIAGRVRRAFGRKGELVITDGSHEIDWNDLPKRVEISLRGDQFDHIVELARAGAEVELEFDIDNRFYQGPVTQYNVIADLVGSEKPDEYVIVGGHIDSWDGAEGAQDNGTGVATTLEAARLLAKSGVKPKRTIRFELWSGEEQGLFGSEGFVRDHAAELERISAVLVHDGGTNYLSGIVCTPEMEADLRAVFAPVVALDAALPFTLEVSEGLRNSGDSDHASFLSKGVPGFFWEQAGDTDYDFVHHTQNDTFETARQDYQRHSAIVVAVGALGIANLDSLLSRENMKGLEPRRMGVQLDGTKVSSVFESGVAATAGWKEGDVILTIDGVAMTSRNDITATLQKGGPKKTFTLQRGEEKLEMVLDWSASNGEKERAARAERRAAATEALKH
ncbi:MAG: M20/M25/M40 family metallo-hydrolase [Planctomycetes bacterium]|nr:M20/M25/M40 family metallo-hydrolase [Planctomycetota bacterium]